MEEDILPLINNTNLTNLFDLNKELDGLNNKDDGYTPYHLRPETYIIPILFFIIFLVGVLGNGTLVVIFLKHRAMRNVPNTYILSLALADLLVIIICVPFASVIYTFDEWPWGATWCRISECAKDVSIGVSVFTLTALATERYCVIVNPLRKLQTRPLTVLTAVMIWLLAILCASPAAIVSDTDEGEIYVNGTVVGYVTYCTPYGKNSSSITTKTYAKYATVYKALVYYLIPLLIISVLYILMANRLHISARDMPGEIAGQQSRQQAKARRHVARMVIAFVIIFFICFFPLHVFELWFHLNPHAREDYNLFWHIVRIVGFCTSFLNSCVNPVALYFISGVFRQLFHRYLCCRQIPQPSSFRGNHSTATGNLDTSYMSVRRSTINFRSQSIHGNNNNFHLHHQPSIQQHTILNSNGTGSPIESIVIKDKSYGMEKLELNYM